MLPKLFQVNLFIFKEHKLMQALYGFTGPYGQNLVFPIHNIIYLFVSVDQKLYGVLIRNYMALLQHWFEGKELGPPPLQSWIAAAPTWPWSTGLQEHRREQRRQRARLAVIMSAMRSGKYGRGRLTSHTLTEKFARYIRMSFKDFDLDLLIKDYCNLITLI